MSTITKIQAALERLGVKVIDNHPEGGFTLSVSKEALNASPLYFFKGFYADKAEAESPDESGT